jgi:hypothetical protein
MQTIIKNKKSINYFRKEEEGFKGSERLWRSIIGTLRVPYP